VNDFLLGPRASRPLSWNAILFGFADSTES
jgi:hypothetical protein